MAVAWKNKLYFGDNLPILRDDIGDESVDLIYLDPPFNSNANYNVLFKEHSGQLSHAQIQAFTDTWKWSIESETAYNELITTGPQRLAELMEAFRKFLKTSDMMAYIAMMAPRLLELHRVLKATGSLYLHCDPTASHYIKLVLDAIFSPANFRNEITWKRTTTHSDSKTWSKVADILFFYTKSDEFTWNTPHEAHSEKYKASKYRHDDGDGRIYRLDNMTSPNPRPNMMYEWKGFPFPAKGWRYSKDTMAKLDGDGRVWYPHKKDGSLDASKRPQLKRYLDEMPGGVMGCIWTDISPINSQAQERLQYPTQKPEELLDRIISASSNKGDVVLDPFCGCGTTIAVAEQLKRKWIGIDITHLAVSLMRHRLKKTMGTHLAPYEVLGAPTDLEGAEALAKQDRYQFQYWALGLIGAQALHDQKGAKKKGADSGIDGYLKFIDDKSGKAKTIIISVKSGHVQVKDVRELIAVVAQQKAVMGLFLTFEEPSKPMKDEALTEGFYLSPLNNKPYPVIQILTVAELLEGKLPKYPESAGEATLKAAPSKGHKVEQPKLI